MVSGPCDERIYLYKSIIIVTDIAWNFIKTGRKLVITKDMLLMRVPRDFNAETANTICILIFVS